MTGRGTMFKWQKPPLQTPGVTPLREADLGYTGGAPNRFVEGETAEMRTAPPITLSVIRTHQVRRPSSTEYYLSEHEYARLTS